MGGRRTMVLVGLIVLVALVIGLRMTMSRLNQASPGAVVLRYIAALDRRDLVAANGMLSSDSHAWALDTPAEKLGVQCPNVRIEDVIPQPQYAAVDLTCPSGPDLGPYFLIKENGIWKVRKFH